MRTCSTCCRFFGICMYSLEARADTTVECCLFGSHTDADGATYYPRCENQRKPEGPCGPDGKLWEPKHD